MSSDFVVCKYDGAPCDRFYGCYITMKNGRPFYACVRIRFKGANSVRDKGMGMTILEKLERAGLIPK